MEAILFEKIKNEIRGVIPINTPPGIDMEVSVIKAKPTSQELEKNTLRINNIHIVVGEGPTTIFTIVYTNGFKASISIAGKFFEKKGVVKTVESALMRLKELGEAKFIIREFADKLKQKEVPVPEESNDNYDISHKRFLLSLMRKKTFFKTVENSFVEDKDFISKYKDLPKEELDKVYAKFSEDYDESVRMRERLSRNNL